MDKLIEKLENLSKSYDGSVHLQNIVQQCIDIVKDQDKCINVDTRVKIGDKYKDDEGWECEVVELFLSIKGKTYVGWEDKYEQRIEEIDDFLKNLQPIEPPSTMPK